jgi:hypothetical protein
LVSTKSIKTGQDREFNTHEQLSRLRERERERERSRKGGISRQLGNYPYSSSYPYSHTKFVQSYGRTYGSIQSYGQTVEVVNPYNYNLYSRPYFSTGHSTQFKVISVTMQLLGFGSLWRFPCKFFEGMKS